MMIFNWFTVANNYYNIGAQWPNSRGHRFFLPTNKTFEGICLVLEGKFLQKELWILFVLKIVLYKRLLNLVLSLYLWTSQLNKVTQDLSLICFCKQKTFSPVLSINSGQKDKALPVKISILNFVSFFVYFGNSLLD